MRLEREKALTIAEMRFNQSCPENELTRKALAAAEPFLAWYDHACTREAVVPGSIADLLFQAEEKGELDEGVASNIVRSFVGGGVDSTISALGHTLHHLARNPGEFAKVKADLKKVRAAFEEGIRMDMPFQFSWRTTIRDCELSGFRLAWDTKVAMLMGAANRDPRRWTGPDVYNISRDTVGNYLGFGQGTHQCVGQMIARLEADAILTALISKTEEMELAGAPVYHPVNQMRMLDSLPLRLSVARRPPRQ